MSVEVEIGPGGRREIPDSHDFCGLLRVRSERRDKAEAKRQSQAERPVYHAADPVATETSRSYSHADQFTGPQRQAQRRCLRLRWN